MQGPRSEYQRLDDYMDAMTSGRVATAPSFVCPICFGPARASASPRGEDLSVSVHCPCSAMQLDRVSKWPGWESLLSPPPPGFNPNPLGLTRGRRPSVGVAFGRHRGQAVPCSHCGAPLATNRAKQCFVCGTDWHDPDNVVRRVDPKKNPWGLKWKAMYVAELCQDPSGLRYTRHREEGADGPDPHRVFETPAHPGWQWVAWGQHGFAGRVATTTGVEFTFAGNSDGDVVWLTWDEVRWLHRSLRGEVRRDQIAWATDKPPRLPPT